MDTMTCEAHGFETCKVCDPKGTVLGVNQHPNVLTGQFLPDSEVEEDDGSE